MLDALRFLPPRVLVLLLVSACGSAFTTTGSGDGGGPGGDAARDAVGVSTDGATSPGDARTHDAPGGPTIQCGQVKCDLASHTCCVGPSGGGTGFTCQPGQGCPGGQPAIHCDARSCANGVCCLSTDPTLSTRCEASCTNGQKLCEPGTNTCGGMQCQQFSGDLPNLYVCTN